VKLPALLREFAELAGAMVTAQPPRKDLKALRDSSDVPVEKLRRSPLPFQPDPPRHNTT
jgi:hypothetical protein